MSYYSADKSDFARLRRDKAGGPADWLYSINAVARSWRLNSGG